MRGGGLVSWGAKDLPPKELHIQILLEIGLRQSISTDYLNSMLQNSERRCNSMTLIKS